MASRSARLAPLAIFAACLATSATSACTSHEDPPALPSVPCTATLAAAEIDTTDLRDVGVWMDAPDDAGLDLTRADVGAYLGKLWGGPVAVSSGAPDGSKRVSLWISTSDAARSKAALADDRAFAIKRVDDGASTTLVVAAKEPRQLTFGVYAMLEALGVRFFHPRQELVPAFGRPTLPRALDFAPAAPMASRGIQFHTLHPIEYSPLLNEPSAEHLAGAKQLVDWLVKTGQNHLQWVLLSTVPFDAWTVHASAIVDYAHARGVTVGFALQTWGGASLQNNFVLVSDTSKWQAQMEAQLDKLLAIPFDVLELAMGEFVSTGAQSVIDWLSHATDYALSKRPTLEVNVQNHVGNYKQLYVDYQGQTVFFYHLPQYADARLGQTVHTLALFDLYRNWGTYGHPDFHLQRDYILKEAPSRRVKYFPESAYWISADVDVPLFLPEFIHSRHNDVHTLTGDLASQKLPALRGHLMFSSGHEWGYWMTDYVTAKMLWRPEAPLEAFVKNVGAAYGTCAADFTSYLSRLIDVQSKYVFDQRLLPYLQGENAIVDLGYLAGLETHPQRRSFEEVLTMSSADRAAFKTSVVDALDALATEMRALEEQIAPRCRGSDATIRPWCDELWDGVAITRNRTEHASHLFKSVLAKAEGRDADADFQAAVALTAEARAIVARREAHYRFPLDALTGTFDNATVYKFGYLRPAHTLCYWTRREEQVRFVLDNGIGAKVLSLPTCQD